MDAPAGEVLIHLAETNDRTLVNKEGHIFEQNAADIIQGLAGKKYGKIVYASSAAVYGDQHIEPRRTDEYVEAVDSYSRIKLHSERVVLEHGGVIARLTNLYGPGMSETNVISTIIKQLQLDSIQLRDATPVRDFLWVDDAATAFVKMVFSNLTGIFNVGSGTGVSIYELSRLALFFSGHPNKHIISMQKEKKISTLIVDISKTTDAFCWRPNMKLKDGIENLITIGMGSILK